jgi:hypothetical protein
MLVNFCWFIALLAGARNVPKTAAPTQFNAQAAIGLRRL